MSNTDHLLVTVNNHTKNDIYFDMQIICPNDIKVKMEINNKGKNKLKISDTKVDAKKLVYRHVCFEYQGNDSGSSQATIEITCKDKNKHISLNKKQIINLIRIK